MASASVNHGMINDSKIPLVSSSSSSLLAHSCASSSSSIVPSIYSGTIVFEAKTKQDGSGINPRPSKYQKIEEDMAQGYASIVSSSGHYVSIHRDQKIVIPPPQKTPAQNYQELCSLAERQEKEYNEKLNYLRYRLDRMNATDELVMTDDMIRIKRRLATELKDLVAHPISAETIVRDSFTNVAKKAKEIMDRINEAKDVNGAKDAKDVKDAKDGKEAKEEKDVVIADRKVNNYDDGEPYGCEEKKELSPSEVEFMIGGKKKVYRYDSKVPNQFVFGGRYAVEMQLAGRNERDENGYYKCSRVNIVIMIADQIYITTVGGMCSIRTISRSSHLPLENIEGETVGVIAFGLRERVELLVGSVKVYINPKVCTICLERPRGAQLDCDCKRNRCCDTCAKTILAKPVAQRLCPNCRGAITQIVNSSLYVVSSVRPS